MNTNKKVIDCSICLDDIEKDIEFLPCIHGFHKECIDGWIKEKPECPVCKVPIYLNTPEQLYMYNCYKDIRERLLQEESRFFHQVSSGIFDNNTNILRPRANDRPMMNFIQSTVLRDIIQAGNAGNAGNNDYGDTPPGAVDTVPNENDEKNEDPPIIISGNVIRDIIHSEGLVEPVEPDDFGYLGYFVELIDSEIVESVEPNNINSDNANSDNVNFDNNEN